MIGVTPHGESGFRHELVYGRSISSVANEQSHHQKQRQGLLAHQYSNRNCQLFLSEIVQLSTFTCPFYLILDAPLPGTVRAWRTRFAGEKGAVIPSYRGSAHKRQRPSRRGAGRGTTSLRVSPPSGSGRGPFWRSVPAGPEGGSLGYSLNAFKRQTGFLPGDHPTTQLPDVGVAEP